MFLNLNLYCKLNLLQGGWENDETVKEAAVREAVEEAGVRGDLKVKSDTDVLICMLFAMYFNPFSTIHTDAS